MHHHFHTAWSMWLYQWLVSILWPSAHTCYVIISVLAFDLFYYHHHYKVIFWIVLFVSPFCCAVDMSFCSHGSLHEISLHCKLYITKPTKSNLSRAETYVSKVSKSDKLHHASLRSTGLHQAPPGSTRWSHGSTWVRIGIRVLLRLVDAVIMDIFVCMTLALFHCDFDV